MRSTYFRLILFTFCLVTVFVWPALGEALHFNLLSRQVILAMVQEELTVGALGSELQEWAPRNCRASWFAALLADGSYAEHSVPTELAQAIACSDAHIPLAQILEPENIELARMAVQSHPTSGDAWFWLARLQGIELKSEAIQAYRHGLELNPNNGIAWRELGDLLVEDNPEAAIAAYLESCYNGDPDNHGCLRAGRTAARQGDFEAAILYLRLSHWPPALEQADELEQQLAP